MSDSEPRKQPPAVLGVAAEAYGDQHKPHLLDQYKLAVEMADRTSARRQETNNFFLAVSTSLVAFTALFADAPDPSSTMPSLGPLGVLVVSVSGVSISVLWLLLLRSYRSLNAGKYDVITVLEDHLPARIYGAEWEYLAYGVTQKHRTLTKLEGGVPLVFGALFLFTVVKAGGDLAGLW